MGCTHNCNQGRDCTCDEFTAEETLGLFEKVLIVCLGIVGLLCAVSPALFS